MNCLCSGPRITKIWAENDPYNRQIRYSLDFWTSVLKSVADAGGRLCKYDYDFQLMFGGEAGTKITVVTMLLKVVTDPLEAWSVPSSALTILNCMVDCKPRLYIR